MSTEVQLSLAPTGDEQSRSSSSDWLASVSRVLLWRARSEESNKWQRRDFATTEGANAFAEDLRKDSGLRIVLIDPDGGTWDYSDHANVQSEPRSQRNNP